MQPLRSAEMTSALSRTIAHGTKIDKHFSGYQEFADALAFRNSQNEDIPWQYSRYKDIADYLVHIKVNPHNKTVSELIELSYVVNSNRLVANKNAINVNKIRLYRFICSVVNVAHSERIASLPTGVDGQRGHPSDTVTQTAIYIIHGERGVGKTFFLNYALTKSSKFLDRQRTIWVRVNLAYRSGYERDIVGWMYAQAAKICCRYYDVASAISNKKLMDNYGHLLKWIDGNHRLDATEKYALRKRLRTMYEVFSETASDEPISEDNCDSELCRELYGHLRREGWSFIFALDGFDRLDLVPEQIDRFSSIRAQIEKFISMRTAFGATIIVVTRTETFQYLSSVDPFQSIPPGRKYQVVPVEFSDVVFRRLDAIETVLRRRARPEHVSEIALVDIIGGFRQELRADELLIGELNEFLFVNNREKLQSIHLLFLDYVNKRTGKGYAVLEHVMKAGHRFAAVAYRATSKGSRIELQHSTELNHESRFLPIITRPPVELDGAGRVSDGGTYSHSYLLSGIRIIQLVKGNDLHGDAPTVNDVCWLCENLFGYNRSIIDAQIRELEAFECIRILRDSRLDVNSDENRLIVMPKGVYLVDKCLGDVAYLNMCSMRTLIGKSVLSTNLITLSSIDGDGRNSLVRWIRNKINNAIFLFYLLCALDASQREEYTGRRSAGGFGKRRSSST